MSTRLQVLLDDAEFEAIRELARDERMTVAGWVRRALRTARMARSAGDAARKLEAVEAACRHELPVADVDQMLAEIERGYLPADDP